jgi:beta-phosphoglucomutase-like phosphatase (HAD superfamily)
LPAEPHLRTVTAVIFDPDGTLIDSAPIYLELIDVILLF